MQNRNNENWSYQQHGIITDSVVIILIVTFAIQKMFWLCLEIICMLSLLTYWFVLSATFNNISAISWRPLHQLRSKSRKKIQNRNNENWSYQQHGIITDNVVIMLIVTFVKQKLILLCLVIICMLSLLTFWFVLSATFNNSSAISWRPHLAVEDAGVSGESHRP